MCPESFERRVEGYIYLRWTCVLGINLTRRNNLQCKRARYKHFVTVFKHSHDSKEKSFYVRDSKTIAILWDACKIWCLFERTRSKLTQQCYISTDTDLLRESNKSVYSFGWKRTVDIGGGLKGGVKRTTLRFVPRQSGKTLICHPRK